MASCGGMKAGWDSVGRLAAEDLVVDFAGRRGRMLNFSPTVELSEVGGELSPSLRYQARPVPAVSLEFQTWSLWLAIWSMVRPVTAELGSVSVMAGADSGRSKSSCSLMRSQLGLSEEPQREPPDLRGAMRMSVHLPCSLVPSRTNLSEPSCKAFVTSS